jgi:predicted nucleic acid-binding protein
MRVFLDSTVLFAASIGGGSGKLWSLPSIELVTSDYAVQETWLRLEHSPAVGAAREKLAHLLRPPMNVVPNLYTSFSPLPEPWNLSDPEDIPILLAAIDAKAKFLLSGDVKCFGEYLGREINGLTILRPGRFLANLGL